jgi:hypothetical protein
MAFAPDGSLLVVWQNTSAILTNGARLEEAFAAQDIAAARRDAATGVWTSWLLAAHAHLEHNPLLREAADGSALAMWVENPSNTPHGASFAPNAVRSRVWRNGAWETVNLAAPAIGYLLWYDAAYDGRQAVALFNVDEDDNAATADDAEIYGASWNGTNWSAVTRLTSNSVADINPRIAFDADGRLVTIWQRGGELVARHGDLALDLPEPLGIEGASISSRDLHLIRGQGSALAALWVDTADDGSGPDPFLALYDGAAGEWSRPVRVLRDAALERDLSAAFAPDGSLFIGLCRVAIAPDTNGVPRFGQVDVSAIEYRLDGDLQAGPSGLTLPREPRPGATTDVSLAVQNAGEITAENIAVVLYDDDPGRGGMLIGTTQVIARLAPGAETTVTFAWFVPTSDSPRRLTAIIDPAWRQMDRDRSNNIAYRDVLAPDLAVAGVRVAQPDAENRILSARITKSSAIPVDAPIEVTFREGARDGELLAAIVFSNLTSGADVDASVLWNMSEGAYTSAFVDVYVEIDPAGVVAQINSNNDIGVVAVMTPLDSDSDGLLDGEEARFGSDPFISDSDGDGLNDADEARLHGTSPVQRDSDADGQSDREEMLAGTDARSATDVFAIVECGANGVYRVLWSAKAGYSYRVQRSADLNTWADAPSGTGAYRQAARTAAASGVEIYEDVIMSTNASALHYRVIVE